LFQRGIFNSAASCRKKFALLRAGHYLF
jgi:hypothetical protein